MLGKLLKYEIKATARTFLPLYLALIVFAAVNQLISLLSPNEWGTPEIISMTLYVIILIGMFVMTYIVMIQRFYKNLLSDEGYLMFTLPSRPWMHITSKLLVSMMWMFISGVAAVISIGIIAIDKIDIPNILHELSRALGWIYDYTGSSIYLFTVESIIGGILSLASSILIIYASIAIGHLANRHRVIASIGSFLALNTITQIFFTTAGMLPMNYTLDHTVNLTTIHLLMLFGIVMMGILAAGYFIIANIILSKRLNLE